MGWQGDTAPTQSWHQTATGSSEVRPDILINTLLWQQCLKYLTQKHHQLSILHCSCTDWASLMQWQNWSLNTRDFVIITFFLRETPSFSWYWQHLYFPLEGKDLSSSHLLVVSFILSFSTSSTARKKYLHANANQSMKAVKSNRK